MKDNKITEIAKRKGFTNFWEVFDYMLHASYSELDALKIGLELFHGNIWGEVIEASYKTASSNTLCFSGSTTLDIVTNFMFNGETTTTSHYFAGVDPASVEPDDLLVEIHFISNKGMSMYKPIYKSYIQTKIYDRIPELEEQIKSISLTLKTELAINLFKEGCKQIK